MALNRERRSNAGNRLRALLNQEIEMEELFDDEGVDEEFDIRGKEEEDIVDSDFDQSSADESADEEDEEANLAEDPEEAKQRKKRQAMLNHLKTGKSSMSLPGVDSGGIKKGPASKAKAALQPGWLKKPSSPSTPSLSSGATTPTPRRAPAPPKIPAEIRKSSRRTTVQNKKETELKLQEYEARRAAQPKREKVVVHKMTQEELLEEAKKTEQLNLASLQAFKALELEKKRVVKKKEGITGPFIRYHSFAEWINHGPLIQALGDAGAPTTPAGTRPSTRPTSRMASRAGSVGPDGQEGTVASTVPGSGGGVPPQKLAQTLAQTLLAQQGKDGKSAGGGRTSRMASRESSPTPSLSVRGGGGSGTNTPGTPMSVDDVDQKPLLQQHQTQKQDEAGSGTTAAPTVLFHTMTMSAASIARKRKRLHASQMCGRNWVSFIGFDSDEDLPTNEWSYAENYPEKNPICPITGLPAKYRDPTSGIPYANKEAYKVLQNVMRHGYVWSNGLNAYCHDVGQVLPRNTPAGMAEALSGGHHPPGHQGILFNNDGDLISAGVPGGGGGGYIYRRRTGALQSPVVQ